MKPLLLLLLLQITTTPPEPRYFHHTRTIQAPSGAQSCAILDAPIFLHAAPPLADIRLYTGPPASLSELPYVITTSQSTLLPPDPARLLNLGLHGHSITFDLAMPPRPYTQLTLDLDGHDFLASATLTGTQSLGHPGATLGTFTLFDLTAQHLSRSTSIPLQESTYPFLHVELSVTPAPGSHFAATPAMVHGASVPPNREAQTLYTPFATTTQFTQRGHDSIATLALPAHIPVERVAFTLAPVVDGKPDHTNFSRTVRITAAAAHPSSHDRHLAPPETLSGEISRVNLTEAGQKISQQSLSIPATLGENTTDDATVEIAVQNGDDHPLPLAAVTLEMRQRSLCFQTPEGPSPTALTLAYGDPTLAPPIYDLARLFNPASPTRPATLLAEQPNPLYTPRPTPQRSLTDRHPELLWLALLAVIGVLAVVAFRSSKHIHPHPPS